MTFQVQDLKSLTKQDTSAAAMNARQRRTLRRAIVRAEEELRGPPTALAPGTALADGADALDTPPVLAPLQEAQISHSNPQ